MHWHVRPQRKLEFNVDKGQNVSLKRLDVAILSELRNDHVFILGWMIAWGMLYIVYCCELSEVQTPVIADLFQDRILAIIVDEHSEVIIL